MKKILCLLIVLGLLCFFGLNNLNLKVNAQSNEIDYVLTTEAHSQYLENALSEDAVYSSNITEYHSNLTAYFDNLTYNLGMNYKGSCGYVGIGMLLSYYDTFLTDGLIPENYDVNSIGNDFNMTNRRNSPGVMRDIIADPDNLGDSSYGLTLTASEYYNHILSISNQSLHAKLISIGASKGYYNFSDSNNPAGLSFFGIQNVLTSYLTEIAMYENSDFNITYAGSNVKDFVIENVSNGIPVLLGITGIPGGHIVIAYDYDAETDSIYCHFGWGADKTHRTIQSEFFSNYNEALTLTINKTHTHTNNYGVTSITNNVPTTNYYCYDNNLITIVNHDFTYNYTSSSDLAHRAFCECGESKLQLHNMVSNVCSECGYSHVHEFDEWEYYSHIAHIAVCDCGETGVTRAHIIRASEIVDNKAICLECEHLLDLRFDMAMTYSNDIKYSINGSYILPSGIVVLMDEDIDSYFAGTLLFYKEDEIPQLG